MYMDLAGRAPIWLRTVTLAGFAIGAMHVASGHQAGQMKKRMAADMAALGDRISIELGKVQNSLTAIRSDVTDMKDMQRDLDCLPGMVR